MINGWRCALFTTDGKRCTPWRPVENLEVNWGVGHTGHVDRAVCWHDQDMVIVKLDVPMFLNGSTSVQLTLALGSLEGVRCGV